MSGTCIRSVINKIVKTSGRPPGSGTELIVPVTLNKTKSVPAVNSGPVEGRIVPDTTFEARSRTVPSASASWELLTVASNDADVKASVSTNVSDPGRVLPGPTSEIEIGPLPTLTDMFWNTALSITGKSGARLSRPVKLLIVN
jgi:hypothetical protein